MPKFIIHWDCSLWVGWKLLGLENRTKLMQRSLCALQRVALNGLKHCMKHPHIKLNKHLARFRVDCICWCCCCVVDNPCYELPLTVFEGCCCFMAALWFQSHRVCFFFFFRGGTDMGSGNTAVCLFHSGVCCRDYCEDLKPQSRFTV